MTTPSSDEARWYFRQGENQFGPVPTYELRELARNGQLRESDMILADGAADWIRAGDVADLFTSEVKAERAQTREQGRAGLWRDGNILVIRKGAPLPAVCVKTGQASTTFLKRKLHYLHPAVYLLILLHVLIFLIVALIVRKKVEVHVPLCDEALRARSSGILIAWILAISAIGLIVGAFHLASWQLGLFGGVLFFGAAIYGSHKAAVLSPKKIDNRNAWLKGACPQFLDGLPEWRGGRHYR